MFSLFPLFTNNVPFVWNVKNKYLIYYFFTNYCAYFFAKVIFIVETAKKNRFYFVLSTKYATFGTKF